MLHRASVWEVRFFLVLLAVPFLMPSEVLKKGLPVIMPEVLCLLKMFAFECGTVLLFAKRIDFRQL